MSSNITQRQRLTEIENASVDISAIVYVTQTVITLVSGIVYLLTAQLPLGIYFMTTKSHK